MNRIAFHLLPAALALSCAAPSAHAQAAPADAPAETPFPVTANVALTNNYVSRGFTQTWSKPAIQGGLDYAHSSGLFLGTWMSSLSGTEYRGGSIEWDLYGGYTGTVSDLSYTAALYQYVYPGTRSPLVNGHRYDYTEVKLGVTYKMLTANAYITVSDHYFGTFDDARGSGYYEVNLNPDLGNGFTLLAHVGYGAIRRHSVANWKDYKLGVSKAFAGNWTLTGAYTQADDKEKFWTGSDFSIDATGNTYSKRLGKAAFVVTLAKTF